MDKKALFASLLSIAMMTPSAAFAVTADATSDESEEAAKEEARAEAVAYCAEQDKQMEEVRWKVDRDGDSYVVKLTYSCKKSS